MIYIGLFVFIAMCPRVMILEMSHVGTPHTLHYPNAADAIKAGKHVLMEKPAIVNAEESSSLVSLARQHGVFLMEAMWTRFQPIAHVELVACNSLRDLFPLLLELTGAPLSRATTCTSCYGTK